MDFATALKAAREQMGLTQTELGKALHVSFSTINRYENGRHMPTPIILDAMKSRGLRTCADCSGASWYPV